MPLPLEPDTISHGIQLAVAPVFLLTAVAGMIGVVANRLARIIDRARLVESQLMAHPPEPEQALAWKELGELRTRGLLANGSIGLLTLCSFSIGGTIVVLFLGETVDLPVQRVSIFTFLAALVCFMLALACFFTETMIATRLLNFGKAERRRAMLAAQTPLAAADQPAGPVVAPSTAPVASATPAQAAASGERSTSTTQS